MLRRWFINNQRDFPWRQHPTPYAVWVSEVMLQQTRASVVIPYFERWMALFPTIQQLSEASLEAVIKAWEGLGYYSRARNLHEGAKYVVEHFGGCLPEEEELLQRIKGLGPYTIGAIRSFAFHKRAPAVDGNVMRVMARYHDLHEDISKSRTVVQLRELTYDSLPEKDPHLVMEGLIELGATLCGKQPLCLQCPLNESCKGFANGTAQQLPIKKKPPATEFLSRAVALIRYGDFLLVKKCLKGEIMSDLHEFPYIEQVDPARVMLEFHQKFGQITFVRTLPQVQHSFTRYRVTLTPYCFVHTEREEISGFFWHPASHLHELPFSSGHRRLLELLSQH